jgi:hypothetical protein
MLAWDMMGPENKEFKISKDLPSADALHHYADQLATRKPQRWRANRHLPPHLSAQILFHVFFAMRLEATSFKVAARHCMFFGVVHRARENFQAICDSWKRRWELWASLKWISRGCVKFQVVFGRWIWFWVGVIEGKSKENRWEIRNLQAHHRFKLPTTHHFLTTPKSPLQPNEPTNLFSKYLMHLLITLSPILYFPSTFRQQTFPLFVYLRQPLELELSPRYIWHRITHFSLLFIS